MRTHFQMLGLALALLTTVFWFFGGPHFGWTQTSRARIEKDPVTELEYPVIEKRFVPGLDFVGAGVGAGALSFAVSFLFKRRQEPQENA